MLPCHFLGLGGLGNGGAQLCIASPGFPKVLHSLEMSSPCL